MRFAVIDDNPDHRELVISRLQKAFPRSEFQEVIRRPDLENLLRERACDLVLTDYRLHWTDGLQIVRLVTEAMPHVPVVMVTDTGSEEIAAEGMKSGLSDYVLKGHMQRLPLVVRESLEKARLRREHEEALLRLRISEGRYRAISELCSDYAYAFRIDPQGNFAREWITQAFTRITGYEEHELDPAGVMLPIVHAEDRALITQSRETLLRGEPFVAEFRIVTKSGTVRWLRDNARPEWDEQHTRVIRVFGAGQDITERKEAEQQQAQLIREQAARAEAEAGEQRYHSLAEAIPQIVWTARPDGRIDYYNERWFEYTGLTPEESYSPEGWRAVLHPEDVDRCVERWCRSLRTGGTYDIETRLRRGADGAYCWHLVRAVPLRDNDGRIVKWFGTSTDVDEQKRSQEAMQQAQKLESIGLLAGGVAHDFNNLLTGMIGNTSLALDELPRGSSVRNLLEEVLLAGERAADLTRQLLAYSGKGRFFVQPVDVSELVREISTLLRTSISRKIELRLDLDPDIPLVEADATQIQQLVMNLVINGAEAIGDDAPGVVSVSTSVEEITEEFLRRQNFVLDGISPGPHIVIEVADTGCGMDDRVKTQIFDPFFTTKFTGRGLGMAAALGIVRGHKGAIRLESGPGKGTIFWVMLPVSAERTKPKAPPTEMHQDLRGSGTILVVDDEEVVRRAAKSTLQRYGYRVMLAENGREGIEMFRRHAAEISLVLLDMTMPVMSGEDALPYIKSIRSDVPVIASSGYSELVAVQRFAGKGLAGFIQKPYTAAKLADKVRAAVAA